MTTRQQTVLLLAANGVRSLSTLVVGFGLTRLLTQDDFGAFRGGQVVASLAVTFIAAGLPQSLLNLYSTAEPGSRRALLALSFLQLACLGILGAGLLAGVGDFLALHVSSVRDSNVIRAAGVFALGQLLASSLPLVAIACGQLRRSALFEVGIGIGTLAGSLVPPMCGATAAGTLVVLGGVNGAIGLGGWLAALRGAGRLRPNFSMFRRQWVVAGPLTINSLLGNFGQQLDKMLVFTLFTPAAFAVYSCGAVEVPFVTLIPFVLAKVVAPRLARHYHDGEPKEFLRVWHESIRMTLLLTVPMAVALFLAAELVVSLLFTKAYVSAAEPFRIFLLLLPLRFTAFTIIAQMTGRTASMFFSGVITIATNLLLAVILVPRFGPSGAAAAAVAAQAACMIYLLQRTAFAMGRSIGSILPVSLIARCWAVGCLACVGGIMVRRLVPGAAGMLTAAFVGTASYVVAVFRLRILRRTDFAVLNPRELLGFAER